MLIKSSESDHLNAERGDSRILRDHCSIVIIDHSLDVY